jgi:hypothetical protein
MWQVQFKKYKNGAYWARDPDSIYRPKARRWHWVMAGNLRKCKINTPVFANGWKVKWRKRKGKSVWAVNIHSKAPSARRWHWIEYATLKRAGIQWIPKLIHTGRFMDCNGYIRLTRRFMPHKDVALCNKHDLWGRTNGTSWQVLEHRLVAFKKYGKLRRSDVVRHLNGIKDDNAEGNLVVGTTQENTMDHNTARLQAMYWRNKYEALKRKTRWHEIKL